MKKILLMTMLVMLAIGSAFTQGEEFPADEFFNKDFYAVGGNIYKITNISLHVSAKRKVELIIHGESYQWKTLSKFLTSDEISRIEKAEQYEAFKRNYIVYIQKPYEPFASSNAFIPIRELNKVDIIKIENIPTEEDIEAEIRRPEEERLAAEREVEHKKKIEEMKIKMKAIAQKDGGYDSMPWETTFEDFSFLYPDAKKQENEGSLVVYSRKGTAEDSEMFYKFFENKLVGGVTVFSDISDQKSTDIATGLKQLYGEPSVSKDLSKHKTETFSGISLSYQDTHLLLVWNKSPTFKIQVDLTAKQLDDGYGIDFMTKAMFNQPLTITVTYSNEKKMAAIKANDEKQKKAADAEAQKKRINNLGL